MTSSQKRPDPESDLKKHLANEARMQRFRWATPIGLVLLSCIVTAGFGFIGWCGDTAVKAFSSYLRDIEKKQDILFEKVGQLATAQAVQIKCLDNDFARCGNCKGYDVC
jgi:hypothetical protein